MNYDLQSGVSGQYLVNKYTWIGCAYQIDGLAILRSQACFITVLREGDTFKSEVQ